MPSVCRKVGVDCTNICPLRCTACFYRHEGRLNRLPEPSMAEMTAKIERGRAVGCNHVTLCGYGEVSLCKNTIALIDYAKSRGMASSIITAGVAPLQRFKDMFSHGLDHALISSHGVGDTMEAIMGFKGGFKKQAELKTWMSSQGYQFRTNCTVQQANYKQLPEIARYEIEMGCWHFVALGFIPIYGWANPARCREVLVHPQELRPYLEEACDTVLESGVHLSIRYHPACALSPRFWPYLSNTRHVFRDPWEWRYYLDTPDEESIIRASVAMGDAVGVRGQPCTLCVLRPHCGGHHRVSHQAYPDSLHAIRRGEVPEQYLPVIDKAEGLFEMNPVNLHCGNLRTCQTGLPTF